MSEVQSMPELKQIVGAMLFVAKHPVTVVQIRKVLAQVAEEHGGAAAVLAKVRESDILEVLEGLRKDLEERRIGIHLAEVAHGYRLQNDAACGVWIRELLERGRPSRLSRPALETLAIIAYRQPCVRSEIEAVRGVQVDQILRNLLEMQLVRIVGRSKLPGRPLLFGTTQNFLEHFGLRSLDELPGIDELRRLESERVAAAATAGEGEAAEGEESPVEAPAVTSGEGATPEETGDGERHEA